MTRSIPPAPGEHLLDEAFMPGNVDDPDAPIAGEIQKRKAQLDRDAATLLLRKPIRVRSGEGADERALPVVDVAGGAENGRALSGGAHEAWDCRGRA